MPPIKSFLSLTLVTFVLTSVTAGLADVPYPTCEDSGCSDPEDFGSYLRIRPGDLPDDFRGSSSSAWKYLSGSGMNIVGAWSITTGRPDVVIAVVDCGIRWGHRDLARKVALNIGELPPPSGCSQHDCNRDGFVSVDDYPFVPDHNGNGLLDGQDLIIEFSDGLDDDGNGYIDDIAGWDFAENDNDPDDDVDYGHGTGQAEDEVGEANNGGGMPGFAPSAFFLPLRVADSFVAVGSDFAQAVVYAVDRRVSVVSEALGTLSASPTSQAAIDYAYRHGIPVVASAADEESRHHNFPATLEHTLWVNSIVGGDGMLVEQEEQYDLLNGCTNYGGHAWVSISSSSCSSEATARAGGLVALLVSHGKNLLDTGRLQPYPDMNAPFSVEEIRQLLRRSAEDINHQDDIEDISMSTWITRLLSAPLRGLFFDSSRFPTAPEWDQYTGYGRPDAVRLLDIREETMPPEADLSGGLRWFDTVDPTRTGSVPVIGSVAAVRRPGSFEYFVEVGCGVEPVTFVEIGRGSAVGRLERDVLATWYPAETVASCGFDPTAAIDDPDAHSVTLRLRVIDELGNLGEDRRTVALHTDPTLHLPLIDLGTSAESSPALVDIDRDGVLDIALATSDGVVHAIRGDTGEDIDGFPTRTHAVPVHPSPAYAYGEVPVPHEAVIAPIAADDIDGDGRAEIVVASIEGKVYAFDDHGRLRRGFPVSTNLAFSLPLNRNRLNDTDPGILAAPTLADLDPPDTHPALEIIVAALDGHVYVWNADGTSREGFPVRVADPAKVVVDPATGVARPRDGVEARDRAAKLVGSPAVGDLDGDGQPEIVVTSNEEYGNEPNGFTPQSVLTQVLLLLGSIPIDLGADIAVDVQGRIYALRAEGANHPDGPFRTGWPARVPILAPGLLPTVGTGTPGSPALADLNGSGQLGVAVFGAVGPVVLLDADGQPLLGEKDSRPRTLAMDFPLGFRLFPPQAGSADAPFFAAAGSGAFGDLDGDGFPEYVAPTGGLRKLLDLAGAANQSYADHQITAWDPREGTLLPAFPRVMDDLQFISSPGLADVDGDGSAEILQGSGVYLLRAYRGDGTTPKGWPKFTNGWLLASPTAGDVDGDGRIEVIAITREGYLFIWNTTTAAVEEAVPWQGFGRDRRNTQNLDSGVPTRAPSYHPLLTLVWELEAIGASLEEVCGPNSTELQYMIRRAIDALEAGSVGRAIALFPRIELGLRDGDATPTDLHERFVSAVQSTSKIMLDFMHCATGDTSCEEHRWSARTSISWGDFFQRLGWDAYAVRCWGRGILLAYRWV